MITYKAKMVGMNVKLQDEAYTSQTCPCCGHRYKPSSRNYSCKECDFEGHRDVVGAMNIRKKYLGKLDQQDDQMKKSTRVVGEMASPIGVRFHPNSKCSSSSRRKTSFEAATP